MGLIFTQDGSSFASGMLYYDYRPALERDSTNRIIIPVEIGTGNQIEEIEAVLDTGSPYTILDPEISLLDGFTSDCILFKEVLLIRGKKIEGNISRLTLTLRADEGESVSIDATVFIPQNIEDWQYYQFPSFLGQSGFLERLRFAIDPTENKFYFGSL